LPVPTISPRSPLAFEVIGGVGITLLTDQLEQVQMLSLVNRVGGGRHSRSGLMVERPHRGRKNDHHQRNNPREPKCKAISFLCHVFPSRPRIDAADVRRDLKVELLHEPSYQQAKSD
jgi:hypothetical protein